MNQTPKRNEAPETAPVPAEIPVAETAADAGLDEEAVLLRKQNGLANVAVRVASRPVWKIILSNVFTFFNLLMLSLGVCLAVAGKYRELTILTVALLNTLINVAQELRAKREIDKLSLTGSDDCTAIRSGAPTRVSPEELVRDDVVELASGETVPADCLILTGTVLVDESLISGEEETVRRIAGEELRSGSVIAGGRCRVRLTAVGDDAFAAGIAAEARENTRVAHSELMHTLHTMIVITGVLVIPLGVALFLRQWKLLGTEWTEAMEKTVTAVIAMIPEGLILLTSLALALGAIRLLRRRVIVRDVSCIETLARADVVCIDKTGTLTNEEVTVGDPVALDPAGFPDAWITQALNAYFAGYKPQTEAEEALSAKYAAGTQWVCTFRQPGDPGASWGCATFNGSVSLLLGTPENLMSERYGEIGRAVESIRAGGRRTLLLAVYEGTPDPATFDEAKLSPAALIPLTNHVRADAAPTFARLQAEGVKLKVFSGDDPLLTSETARAAGIDGAAEWIDASRLKNDTEIADAAEKYTVFGKATPEMKRKLILSLRKRRKHTVAMVGDGVNDLLALQAADCGIAMANGTDAARRASHIVLVKSEFAAFLPIIDEGRRVIHNVQRVGAMFLSKNVFALLIALFSLLFSMQYPFSHGQLSLISIVAIGLPAFCMILEKNADRVTGHFLSNILRRALPGGLTSFIVIAVLQLLAKGFELQPEAVATMSAVILCAVQIGMILAVSLPLRTRDCVIAGVAAAAVLVAIFAFGGHFGLVALDLTGGLILGLLLVLAAVLFVGALFLCRIVDRKLDELRARRLGIPLSEVASSSRLPAERSDKKSTFLKK